MSKLFKDGFEMRLTHEDLTNAIHFWLNKKVLSFDVNDAVVTSLSLHPANKYVARITVARPLLKEQRTVRRVKPRTPEVSA